MITLFEGLLVDKDGRATLHLSCFTFGTSKTAFKDVDALFSILLVGLMGCNIARLSFFLCAVKRF